MRIPIFFVPVLVFFVLSSLVILPLPLRIRLAKGESMFPTYTASEAVLVAWGDKHLDVGDVAVYWNGAGSKVVHRVIDFTRDMVFTQGDNNDFTEEVPWRAIIGKEVAHCPSFLFVTFLFASTFAAIAGVIYELLEHRRRKIYKVVHHI